MRQTPAKRKYPCTVSTRDKGPPIPTPTTRIPMVCGQNREYPPSHFAGMRACGMEAERTSEMPSKNPTRKSVRIAIRKSGLVEKATMASLVRRIVVKVSASSRPCQAQSPLRKAPPACPKKERHTHAKTLCILLKVLSHKSRKQGQNCGTEEAKHEGHSVKITRSSHTKRTPASSS